jgi:hypothetical protein
MRKIEPEFFMPWLLPIPGSDPIKRWSKCFILLAFVADVLYSSAAGFLYP